MFRETPRCRICGGACETELTGLFDDRYGAPGSYDMVRCGGCGMEQIWPQLSEKELKELYERYYNWGGEQGTGYGRLRERFLSSALYRLWLRLDGDIGFHLQRGRGRLLDVGCNEGRALTFFAQNGFQAEGLELNERAAAVARAKGFSVYTLPLGEFSSPEPYDVAVLSNVLEHVVNPVAMLTRVRKLLRPGGRVWISCPNAHSRWRRVFGRHWVHYHVPFHLWQFSPETLRGVLTRARLGPVAMHSVTPSLWLASSVCAFLSQQGRVNRRLRAAPLMAGLTLASRVLLMPLGHLDRQMQGDGLVVVAEA
jgi:2-polyprenyl-3-methyl-5-hydroxy-6-metoxy-1,4-benzoquinol methylase